MDFIKECISKKYLLLNLKPNTKNPICGIKEEGWSKITYENSLKYLNKNSNTFTLRTGLQENGDYIIVLDFDLWLKNGDKRTKDEKTENLFKDFLKLNINKDGIYKSSTVNNHNCIVKINNSKRIINELDEIGKRTFKKKGFELEILSCFNSIIPPTMTKCKVSNNNILNRQFIGEKHILELQENTDIEEWIYNYIKDCNIKKKLKVNDIRTLQEKQVYFNYIEKEEIITKTESIKIFLDHISIERIKNYNNWYKLGYSLKNSFKNEGLNLFKYLSSKDNNYNEKELEYYWKTWNTERYEGLNYYYILDCVKNDNPSKFIYCLLKSKFIEEQSKFLNLIDLFEKNVRKILEPSVWIKKHRKTGDWEHTTYSDIQHIYSEIKPFNMGFLNKYDQYNKKNYYDFLDFIPSSDKIEEIKNTKTFNLFNGYEIEKEKIEVNDKEIENYWKIFENHLLYLVDEDKNTLKFIIQWIANLIHNPLKRSEKCIILQGLEGTGKTTLNEIIKKIIGEKYCYITARPEKTIFDRFNDVLSNKIYVNINEPDFNSFKGSFEEFKSLITDSTINIESKGKPKITLSNYMTFLITTNNEKLFSLSSTDRRFYFIKTSDKIANDTDYFNMLYENINNPKFIKTIYLKLKILLDKNYNFNLFQKNNKTTLHLNLLDNSKNPFYSFLQEFVENIEYHNYFLDEEDNNYIKIKPKELINKYKLYCNNNSLDSFESGKSIKFKLKQIDLNIHKKINNISSYYFKKDSIIDYLKRTKKYED